MLFGICNPKHAALKDCHSHFTVTLLLQHQSVEKFPGNVSEIDHNTSVNTKFESFLAFRERGIESVVYLPTFREVPYCKTLFLGTSNVA